MVEKVFVTANNMATFECPVCKKSKQEDVSKFTAINKAIRLKAKCSCGNAYSVFLERRRHVRKEVDFPGTFTREHAAAPHNEGVMRIKDLSRYGVKLKLNSPPDFNVGDHLKIEFNLDDAKHSLITKEVIVRKIMDTSVGVEFVSVDSTDPSDSAIGFYLLS
jgi:hypothetical protein